jgi:hypothetical protein
MQWVKRGAAGVAMVAASRLIWQQLSSRPVEWNAPGGIEDDQPDSEEPNER